MQIKNINASNSNFAEPKQKERFRGWEIVHQYLHVKKLMLIVNLELPSTAS